MSSIRPLCAALFALTLATAARAAAPAPMPPGPWGFATDIGLNLSQSAYSSNWRGGDEGAITWALNSLTRAERQLSPTFHWKNSLALAYGQTARQHTVPVDATNPGSALEQRWDTPDKTSDIILFESTARWTLGRWADPYVGFSAESQFLDETYRFAAPDGRFVGENFAFNPWRFKESVGAAKVFWQELGEKDEVTREFVSRVGAAFRQTMGQSAYLDVVSAVAPFDYAVRTSRFSTNDGGVEWQTDCTQPLLSKRVLYKGRLLVYQPLYYSKADALKQYDATNAADAAANALPVPEAVADFWKATDVDFSNVFISNITKNLTVSLLVQFVYDKFDAAANVDPTLPLDAQRNEINTKTRKAGQFRENLLLGLTYKLF